MNQDPDEIRQWAPNIEGITKEDIENASSHLNRLMPRRPHGFPVSRDWADMDCRAEGCRYNVHKKCAVPSRCKISNDGDMELYCFVWK